ncbi:hypothetical protein NVP1081O_200 [Vibrio phage 1.081.O._10N.286.52.C2]|nr:hypothetical protein NVP1081O_200 [Vibrio phage 1.081.O._10N.286.52.C2]
MYTVSTNNDPNLVPVKLPCSARLKLTEQLLVGQLSLVPMANTGLDSDEYLLATVSRFLRVTETGVNCKIDPLLRISVDVSPEESLFYEWADGIWKDGRLFYASDETKTYRSIKKGDQYPVYDADGSLVSSGKVVAISADQMVLNVDGAFIVMDSVSLPYTTGSAAAHNAYSTCGEYYIDGVFVSDSQYLLNLTKQG